MIREMTLADFEQFWPVFIEVVNAQETYAFEPEMSFETAVDLWCTLPTKTFVYEEYCKDGGSGKGGENGEVLGSYYIKPNAMGPGGHICNCGYMVNPQARGRGIARQLCEHSQAIALKLGFRAMQFNAVVSTNQAAVALWQKLGFDIIGTIPEAYLHKQQGYVDSYIMYKSLG